MSVSVERDWASVVVRIPMQLKRRRGRKEVIVPEGLGGLPQAAPQEPLVTAVARAFYWQELIESGRYGSITELAEALGADRCYVRRILSLACLAPNIVEAVIQGREPSGLSLEKLVSGMPLVWTEQRRALGAAGPDA